MGLWIGMNLHCLAIVKRKLFIHENSISGLYSDFGALFVEQINSHNALGSKKTPTHCHFKRNKNNEDFFFPIVTKIPT